MPTRIVCSPTFMLIRRIFPPRSSSSIRAVALKPSAGNPFRARGN